jgi:hypothetical protein
MIRKVNENQPFDSTPAQRGPPRKLLEGAELITGAGREALAPNWKAAEEKSKSLAGRCARAPSQKSAGAADLAALKVLRSLGRHR